MTNLRPLFFLLLAASVLALCRRATAQEIPFGLDIQTRSGSDAVLYQTNGLVIATNGVTVTHRDEAGLTVITADSATLNYQTGDVTTDGSVHMQKDNATWNGDHMVYNFKTKEVTTGKFRFGQSGSFVGADTLKGISDQTNGVYRGTRGFATMDDYSTPLERVKAAHFTVVPGKYVKAFNATLMIGNVPVFFLPYYYHSLENDPDHFSFIPGYRSIYGPYLLTRYDWVWDSSLRGGMNLDYRVSRGVGLGPDFKYNYGEYGEGLLKYYYAWDRAPGTDPGSGAQLPNHRQRTYFSYDSNPWTNMTVLSQVAYQSDPYITHDYFETEYSKDIQPKTFVDADQAFRNWSVDTIVQPRVNPYWETVERLPEIRLNGFRQQILETPLFYESQSSVGYFSRVFSDTNVLAMGDYSATRADTFHQITMPETFFGWLNVTPRAGGRFTYYDSASGPGAITTNQSRGVFNTGVEASLTASQVWAGAHNDFLDVDGIRHIIQPSINYVYVPRPNVLPSQLPQFDYELTNSLRLLPLDYPDYNSIDSINNQNTIRYNIQNRIQTKRRGLIDDLVNWNLTLDWNLHPRADQSSLSDIYSDLTLKPRSWLQLNSYIRYNITSGDLNMAQHQIKFLPNNTWNWSVGHFYLRTSPLFGGGANIVDSEFFYRLDENWGARLAHYYDFESRRLQEQDYTIYRDLRSWTAGLTFRVLNNVGQSSDYGVVFTFSFKSVPHYALGGDTIHASYLLGN